MDSPPSPRFELRLHGRERLLGTVVTLPSAPLLELLAEPLDFVWLDLEHGALGAADVPALAVAARAAGCAALARLPGSEWERLPAVVDAGVDGVVAPRLESAVQARRLVERLRHPPRGDRGFAARRFAGYGRTLPARDPLCLAQIESAAGVEAARAIAGVDGIDALVVGCADLALALEGHLDIGAPRVRAAIAEVQDAAAAAGIASGIAGPDDADVLHELAGDRSTLLLCSADVRIYARAIDEAAARLRAPAWEASGVGA